MGDLGVPQFQETSMCVCQNCVIFKFAISDLKMMINWMLVAPYVQTHLHFFDIFLQSDLLKALAEVETYSQKLHLNLNFYRSFTFFKLREFYS